MVMVNSFGEKLFDNGNGEYLTYNSFVLENVVDTEGFSYSVDCPECGLQAEQRDFDDCSTGCVNSYYSINCKHCGYHECDREFCTRCEQAASDAYEAGEKDFNSGIVMVDIFDALMDTLKKTGSISAVDWTSLKLIFLMNSGGISHFNSFYCTENGCYKYDSSLTTAQDAFRLMKSELLYARFCHWLNNRISYALDN